MINDLDGYRIHDAGGAPDSGAGLRSTGTISLGDHLSRTVYLARAICRGLP